MTRATVRRIAIVAAVAALGYVVYGIYAAGFDDRAAPPSSSDIAFHKGRVQGQRISFRSWSAEYEHIFSNSDQSMLELDGVKNGVIYKKGKPYLRMRAQHMSVNTISRDFTVNGPLHVETVSKDPTRSFDTTAAAWSDITQTLTLSKPTKIYSGTAVPLSVGGLTLDVKTGQIDVTAVDGAIRFK